MDYLTALIQPFLLMVRLDQVKLIQCLDNFGKIKKLYNDP